jgi:hypothetical protein
MGKNKTLKYNKNKIKRGGGCGCDKNVDQVPNRQLGGAAFNSTILENQQYTYGREDYSGGAPTNPSSIVDSRQLSNQIGGKKKRTKKAKKNKRRRSMRKKMIGGAGPMDTNTLFNFGNLGSSNNMLGYITGQQPISPNAYVQPVSSIYGGHNRPLA